MKKQLSLILALIMCLGALVVLPVVAETPPAATLYTPAESYAGGTGTETDPYIISTPEQLMKLSVDGTNASPKDAAGVPSKTDFSYGVYYKLGCDIVMNTGDASTFATTPPAYRFTPIGLVYYNNGASHYRNHFRGNFDGDGHTISGLYIDERYSQGTTAGGSGALFASLSNGAVVKDLAIVNSYIRSQSYVGSLVGDMVAYTDEPITVSGIYSDAYLYTNNSKGGGLVACYTVDATAPASEVRDTISDCVFAGTITTATSGGGILGMVNGSSAANLKTHCIQINNCFVSGIVNSDKENTESASEAYMGGIIGRSFVNAEITNCVVTGTVMPAGATKGSTRVGALFGGCCNQTDCNITITDNYVTTVQADYGKIVDGHLANYTPSTRVAETDLMGNTAPTITGWTKRANDLMVPTACASFITGNTDIRMLTGGAVRLAAPTGLRFTARVHKANLDNYISTYGAENVEVGMLIAPNANITGDFTKEALADEAKYIDVPAKVYANAATAETDGYYVFNAAIVGILAANYDCDFSARAYIKVTDGTDVVYIYAEFNGETNTRNVKAIAALALADTAPTEDGVYLYPVVNGETTTYSPYTDAQRAVLSTYAAEPEPEVPEV